MSGHSIYGHKVFAGGAKPCKGYDGWVGVLGKTLGILDDAYTAAWDGGPYRREWGRRHTCVLGRHAGVHSGTITA